MTPSNFFFSSKNSLKGLFTRLGVAGEGVLGEGDPSGETLALETTWAAVALEKL